MPRGRPRKNKIIKDASDEDEDKDLNKNAEEPKQKRKYTKRQKAEQYTTEDGDVIKIDKKKRGRTRGRKKKDREISYKAEDILDYMIRNFPNMKIDKIRNKVIDGLKIKKIIDETPYRLYKIPNTNNYFDDYNVIFNKDGQTLGYYVKQPDGLNKMYLIETNYDKRTFDEIMEEIEN